MRKKNYEKKIVFQSFSNLAEYTKKKNFRDSLCINSFSLPTCFQSFGISVIMNLRFFLRDYAAHI